VAHENIAAGIIKYPLSAMRVEKRDRYLFLLNETFGVFNRALPETTPALSLMVWVATIYSPPPLGKCSMMRM